MIPKTSASSAVFRTFNDCRISVLEVRRNGLHIFSIFNVVGICDIKIIELKTLRGQWKYNTKWPVHVIPRFKVEMLVCLSLPKSLFL